jgi:hyperosmotically inducible protein
MFFDIRGGCSIRANALGLILCSALLGANGVAMAQYATPVAPDNTAVNVRDRAPVAMTAGEQSSAKGDVELTSKIRRAIVKDDSLSMLAHNVKIVSSGGSVTLRGPVKTDKEKKIIAQKAKKIAGAGNVDDQLEVEAQ